MHTLPRARNRAVIPVCVLTRTSRIVNAVKLAGIFAIACVAVTSVPAYAQGVSSGTPPIKPGVATERPAAPRGGAGSISSNPSINARDYVVDSSPQAIRLKLLEDRILELEQEKLRSMERDKEEAAAKAKLEQRLAAVESALRDDEKGDKSAQRPASSRTPGPQTVRAPFVVVDDDGIAIATFDRSSSSRGARLTVGDVNGASVVLAATSDSSFVQLVDQKDVAAVGIEVTPRHQGLSAKGPNGSTWFGSSNEKIALVQVINKAGYPVAELRGMPESQGGQMSIANANGNKLLYVGETEKGVGILRLGPSGYGVAPSMQNQGLPASALIGKKE